MQPDDSIEPNKAQKPWRRVLAALAVSIVAATALGLTLTSFATQVYRDHELDQRRSLFVQVGRQGALNLTTIDFNDVDADVRRILDLSTGTFHDEFQQRAAAFSDFVKKAQSKTTATVKDAGIEAENNGEARILVALAVTTSAPGVPEGQPRAWRMRITVQELSPGQVKVSNVEFVP